MSTLARSQSTPHVPSREAFFSHAASSSHAPPRLSRPKIPRHRSAFALSESTPSAASPGHHTPLAERVEDPFSLSGFFSPGLAVSDQPSDSTWHWLRGDNDETGVDDSRYMASGCVSPISEEDAERLDGENSSLCFDKLLDKLADEIVHEEDKMGVLSLPGVFVPEDAEDASLHDYILSRFCEGDPEDDNALYEAMCALRQAHTPQEDAKDVAINVRRGLFSPVDGEDEYPSGQGWRSLLWQGFGTVLDIVSV